MVERVLDLLQAGLDGGFGARRQRAGVACMSTRAQFSRTVPRVADHSACGLREPQHHGTEHAALHKGEHVTQAQHQLHAYITDLVTQGASAGEIRDEVAPGELATSGG